MRELYARKERHEPTHAYVTTTEVLTLSKWQGHQQRDIIVQVPPWTTLKIVMVSRFGDVGLTDDLTAENGYHLRLDPRSKALANLRWTP